MKYKLKLPLPGVPAGTIIAGPTGFGYFLQNTICYQQDGTFFVSRDIIEKHPDFFEPVEKRWRPELGEIYYCVSICNEEREVKVNQCKWENDIFDENNFKSYNYFRHLSEGTEASKRIQACLLQYHKELNQ